MPIQVTCGQCKQTLAAPDTLAGKAAKCPKCSAIINIPAAAPAAPALSPLGAPAGAAAGFGAPAPSGAIPGGSVCPTCYSSLPPNAVLCVKCGFNLKTGQQTKTVRGPGLGGPKLGGGDGHGEVASMILERASMSIQEDEVAEKSKLGEGLPWWSYLIMLKLAVGFLIVMSMLPVAQAMTAIGGVLIALGSILSLVTSILIYKAAFDDDVVTGLLSLFVPFYVLIFIFSRWSACGAYFLANIAGGLISSFGVFIMLYGSTFVSDKPEDAMAFFQIIAGL